MHKSIVALWFLLSLCVPLFGELAPEARLEAGIQAFRAKDYSSAESELEAAVLGLQGLLGPGSVAAPAFERALIYLALTQRSLNREEDARNTIQRLVSAEAIEPVYATLESSDEIAEFQTLVAELAPDAGLTRVDAVATDVTDDPTEPLPAVIPAPIRSVLVPLTPAVTEAGLSQFASLRQANALAGEGQSEEAVRILESLVNTEGTEREVLIEAALSLYRLGAYRAALPAFERLGDLSQDEEDLRYYHAVVLYETGNVALARRELFCALPFIQRTEHVERFLRKISQ